MAVLPRRQQLVSSPVTVQRQVNTWEVLAASDTVGQSCRLSSAAKLTWFLFPFLFGIS